MSTTPAPEAQPVNKIGAGHLQAMGRLGLAELRAAAYPTSEIAQSDPGLYGNATPSEVVSQRDREPQSPAPTSDSIIDDRVKNAERQAAMNRESRERPSPSLEKE